MASLIKVRAFSLPAVSAGQVFVSTGNAGSELRYRFGDVDPTTWNKIFSSGYVETKSWLAINNADFKKDGYLNNFKFNIKFKETILFTEQVLVECTFTKPTSQEKWSYKGAAEVKGFSTSVEFTGTLIPVNPARDNDERYNVPGF